MLIYLYGTEGFLLKNRIDQLKESFSSKYPNASLDIFDFEEEVDYKKVESVFHQGGGLFASKRMVVLKSLLSLPAATQEKYQELLKDYVADEEVVAIIVSQTKEKKTDLVKFLEKKAKKEKFEKMEAVALLSWIEKEMQERSQKKIKIHPTAAERLIQLTKGDLWKISNEIEKLISYKTEGLVAIEDINQLCQGEAQSKIFDLVDAIAQRNKARAHDLIHSLIKSGENEFYIFTMLLFQFRNLVRVADCQKKGIFSPQAISLSTGLHPFVAKKAVAQLGNFPMRNLKVVYDLAARLDFDVKTGKKDMQEALTYFVAKV